jgi:ectoine hydroxylase-related dioxygenase (phytanoyl-CoA dioxygenase family)
MMQAMSVSEDDVLAYQRAGVWLGPRMVADDEVERLRAAIFRLRRQFPISGWSTEQGVEVGVRDARQRSGSTIWYLNQTWTLSEEVRRLATSPVLGQLLAELMSVPCVRLWGDIAIVKSGGEADGDSTVGWHQDRAYWQCLDSEVMCTVWIPLQSSDERNGGLRFVPGSHRWGLLDGSNTFFDRNLAAQRRRFDRFGRWSEWSPSYAAGQPSFHNCLCLHGSSANSSGAERAAIALHYMPADCCYQGGVPHPLLCRTGATLEVGRPIVGGAFPVVYARE